MDASRQRYSAVPVREEPSATNPQRHGARHNRAFLWTMTLLVLAGVIIVSSTRGLLEGSFSRATDVAPESESTPNLEKKSWTLPSCHFAVQPSTPLHLHGGLALSGAQSAPCDSFVRNSSHECIKYTNTRKEHRACGLHSKTVYPLLVTGPGGAGTNLAASALRNLGYTIGHEYPLGIGSSSWPHAVSDHVIGAKYPFPRKGPRKSIKVLSEDAFRFRTIVHQTRCPMGNIAALTTHNNFSREFIWHAAGINPNLESCLWGAHVWVKWNQHVESYADHRVRLEDYPEPKSLGKHLLQLAGLKAKSPPPKPLITRLAENFLGQKVREHHREHGQCNFDEISKQDPDIAQQLVVMATRYGYESPGDCTRAGEDTRR